MTEESKYNLKQEIQYNLNKTITPGSTLFSFSSNGDPSYKDDLSIFLWLSCSHVCSCFIELIGVCFP